MRLPPPPGFEHIFNRYILVPSVKMELPEASNVRVSGSGVSGPVTEPGSGSGRSLKAKKRKKPDFKRLFSEADEIALLYGMIHYADMIKSNPLANLNGLLEFVKPWLRANPSKYQLQTKISKFRTKYFYNKRRELDPHARKLKAHERRAFEASKRVWANKYIRTERFVRSLEAALRKGPPKKRVKKSKLAVMKEATTAKIENSVEAEVVVVDQAVEVVVDKDQEWRELAMALLRNTHKRALLLTTQTRLILDALADI